MFSAAGILLLTLGVLTWRQCRIYANEMTLWQDTLKKNPYSWLANSRIGRIYVDQRKFDDAQIYMERKIKLASYMKATNPHVYAIMHFKLGVVFEAQGKLDYAVNYYQKSLDIYDNYVLAHYRLAVLLAKQGNYEMALPHLRRAVEIAKSEKNDPLARKISGLLGLLEEKAKNPSDRQPIPWSILDSSYQEQYSW